MAQGSPYGDTTKLSRVNLIMKRGFGFDGNPDGGALTANYNTPNLGGGPVNTEGLVFEGLAGGEPSAFGPFGEGPAPGSPWSGTPGAPEQTLPGIDQISGFEMLQEETERAGGLALDGLLQGLGGVAGGAGLPPGVGDILGGVLDNLANQGPGTFGSSGPFQGNPGGQNFGGQNLGGSPPGQGLGFNLGGSFGALGGLGGQNFGGNFGGGYSP